MLRTLLLIGLVLVLLTAPAFGEGKKPVWKKRFDEVQDYAISANGECIAIATEGNLSLLNNDGKLLFRLTPPESSKEKFQKVDISNNCRFLAVTSQDQMTPQNIIYLLNNSGSIIWDRKYKKQFFQSSREISLDIASEEMAGNYIASVALKVEGESVPVVINKHDKEIWHEFGEISADGKYVVSPCIKIKKKGGSPIEYGLQRCIDTAITPDGKYIGVGTEYTYSPKSKNLYILDNTGTLLWDYHTKGDVFQVLMTSRGEGFNVTAVSRDGYIYFFNSVGDMVAKNKVAAIHDVAFSAVGNYIKMESLGSFDRISYYETQRFAAEKAQKKLGVTILANAIDSGMAEDFFGFLKNKGMTVRRSNASQFDQYKNEKFIIMLGGPDAYNGVGDIVSEVITAREAEEIREEGNREMIVKTNVWMKGQVVVILAGSNREMTREAWDENKGSVISRAGE